MLRSPRVRAFTAILTLAAFPNLGCGKADEEGNRPTLKETIKADVAKVKEGVQEGAEKAKEGFREMEKATGKAMERAGSAVERAGERIQAPR